MQKVFAVWTSCFFFLFFSVLVDVASPHFNCEQMNKVVVRKTEIYYLSSVSMSFVRAVGTVAKSTIVMSHTHVDRRSAATCNRVQWMCKEKSKKKRWTNVERTEEKERMVPEKVLQLQINHGRLKSRRSRRWEDNIKSNILARGGKRVVAIAPSHTSASFRCG